MKSLLVKLVLLISIGVILYVNCERNQVSSSVNRKNDNHNLNNLNYRALSSSSSFLNRITKNSRSKRRLQDVEKMIVEDELMSFLICDMCEKYACNPNYCKFCPQCTIEENGK